MARFSDNFDKSNTSSLGSGWTDPIPDNFVPIATGDMGPWFVPGSLSWLHGWPRIRDTVVLMGTGLHCIGCGKCHGITTVAYRGEIPFPDKAPEWPFKEGDCPICNLEKQVRELRDKSEDKLAARALKNRESE